MKPAGHDSGGTQGAAAGHEATGNTDSTIVQAGRDISSVIHLNSPSKAEQAVPVSVVPPLGRRDPARPLRGRDRLLAGLAGLLDPDAYDGASPCVHVLSGLGGCGKTSIVLDLTEQAVAWGRDVWWVSAVESASLTAGMHAVARQAGASDEELRHGDAPDVLWRHLHAYPRSWLLVVDNADDPDLLAPGPGQVAEGRGWIRPLSSSRGLVVVTSRDGSRVTWGPWSVSHPVGMLDNADAALVLLDHTLDRAGPPDDAASLAARLNGLPLALRLAGAYLAETTLSPWPGQETITSFADYEAALDAGRLDMFDDDAGDSIISRTWELSLDWLQRRGMAAAAPLLRLLSCLADAPVPYRRLLHPDVLADSALFPDMDGTTLWRMLRALADLGLIELNDVAQQPSRLPILRVHPLVRDVSRHHLDTRGPAVDYVAAAAALLHRTADIDSVGMPEWPPAWPFWETITPHALHVSRAAAVTAGLPSEVVAYSSGAAHLVARYLRARGQYDIAEAEYRAVLAVQIRILGEDHPLTLATRHSLGGVLHDRGLIEQAEAEWQAVLGMRRRVLGEDHPDTLFTRHGCAILLDDRGLTDRAEAEWQTVLGIRRRVLGEDHPHTLATRKCLASLRHRRTLYVQAEAEYRIVLDAQNRVVGMRHPDTLATRHWLARVLHDQGLHEAAEAEYEAVLELRCQVLGDDHPHTLATRHWLAAAREHGVAEGP